MYVSSHFSGDLARPPKYLCPAPRHFLRFVFRPIVIFFPLCVCVRTLFLLNFICKFSIRLQRRCFAAIVVFFFFLFACFLFYFYIFLHVLWHFTFTFDSHVLVCVYVLFIMSLLPLKSIVATATSQQRLDAFALDTRGHLCGFYVRLDGVRVGNGRVLNNVLYACIHMFIAVCLGVRVRAASNSSRKIAAHFLKSLFVFCAYLHKYLFVLFASPHTHFYISL